MADENAPHEDLKSLSGTPKAHTSVAAGARQKETATGKAADPGADLWIWLARFTAKRPAQSGSYWQERGLLWTAFAFAAGIAVYMGLPQEPFWPALAGVLALACLAAFKMQRTRGLGPIMVLLVSFLAGATSGAVRTAFVAAPRLGEPMIATLTGTVVSRETRASGVRVVLEVTSVNGKSSGAVVFPKKVRVRIPAASPARTGTLVRLKARLFPPAGPVVPGGYDFSLRAYFSQIGATGFSFGVPEVLEAQSLPAGLRLTAVVGEMRSWFANRITKILGGRPEAGLVVALLVGDRSGISDPQEENLRAAGLAHILAISGLHMALFAGGTYGAVLFLLALFPPVALRWPIHKIAAVLALAAAVFYLVLSGASIATQRSFLMIGLVFLGVLTGRRGLTLRSVALAALFLLGLAPERLLFPGFQMSFAAVICLVAVYELWRNRPNPLIRQTHNGGRPLLQLARSTLRWSLGLAVTALVAGLATGIIAAHHFGRIAPLGLLGNVLGMPIFTLLVMPMGVLSLVLMPFGLASVPLSLMAFGVRLLLDVAGFVSDLSGAAGAIGRIGLPEMLAFSAALFGVLLLPGRWRSLAFGPLILGLVLVQVSRPPDIQIAASGNKLAARDRIGDLRWFARRDSFAGDIWFQTEGVPESEIKSRRMKAPQIACDPGGCVIRAYQVAGAHVPDGFEHRPLKLALTKRPEAFEMDCRWADLVVSDLIAPQSCSAPLVIDKSLRHARGAVSIWLARAASPAMEEAVPEGQGTRKREREDQASAPNALKTRVLAVTDIQFALQKEPRPWNRAGEVTRTSLRQGGG